MSKQKRKPTQTPRDELLQRCAAQAQETDRNARKAEEEMLRRHKEMKRARKAYRRAKEAAKQAAKEAKAAQAELRACLDEAFREMAHTLHTAAFADHDSPPKPEPVSVAANDERSKADDNADSTPLPHSH